MAQIIPFRGIHYNPKKIDHFSGVMTAPYDKINEVQQREYYKRSPYNFIRLDKNSDPDPYQSSALFLSKWMKEGILVHDSTPSLYIYRQEYEWQGINRSRTGFIALLKLDEKLLPHEKTFDSPKRDRLNLVLKTESYFSSIFVLYEDPQKKISLEISLEEKQKSLVSALDQDSNSHTLWRVDDPAQIECIQEGIRQKKNLYIADGHHRYESALEYQKIRKEQCLSRNKYRGDELFHYTLCSFFNMDQDLLILPTHRLVRNVKDEDLRGFLEKLRKDFEVEPASSMNELCQKLDAQNGTTNPSTKENSNPNSNSISIGAILRGDSQSKEDIRFFLLHLKKDSLFWEEYKNTSLRDLDVFVLHKLILERGLKLDPQKVSQEGEYVQYYRSREQGFLDLQEGKFQLAFLLNSTTSEQLKTITEKGEVLPQKSTDFYPKLLSGLLFCSLKGE